MERARWQRREPCYLGDYLTWFQWRTGEGPTQHVSIQTGVSVVGQLRLLLARVVWRGADTACAKFGYSSAALTTWFELTKLRNNDCSWTIDGLLCCVGNKVQSSKM